MNRVIVALLVVVAVLAITIAFAGCAMLHDSRYDLGAPLPASELVKKPAAGLTPKEVETLRKSQPEAFRKAEPERVYTEPVGVTVEKLEPSTSSNRLDEALPYGIIAVWRHEYEPPLPRLAAYRPPSGRSSSFRKSGPKRTRTSDLYNVNVTL